MAKDISDVTEEKLCLQVLINQIEDYLLENITPDSSPNFNLTDIWSKEYNSELIGLRNSIAILMEDATDDTKMRVKEELNN